MGNSINIPPLPPGFVLEGKLPPLPEGFVLESELPPLPPGFQLEEFPTPPGTPPPPRSIPAVSCGPSSRSSAWPA